MNRQKFIPLVLALAAGALGAAAVGAVFFFVFRPAPPVAASEPPPAPRAPTAPTATPDAPLPPEPEIRAADVSSIAIETVYRGFFAAGSKCRQNYVEMFGAGDGVASESSPCTVRITFDSDGRAEKTLEIRRYDRTARASRVVESEAWSGRVAAEDFAALARAVVENEAFRAWNDRILLTASNCRITVRHAGGAKSPMSNVDERATAYLPMVAALRELDAKTNWERR